MSRRLGAAQRTRPGGGGDTRGRLVGGRSALPRLFSRRRVPETRPNARRGVRSRVALVAAHARRRRHVADVLLCGAPDGHQHSCSVAACRLPGSFVKSARATGWIYLAVLHRSSVSRALWQEAAAALASSTALVTGYLCKRGRQRWLVSESDASTNFRGSNRPLSA